VLQLRQALEIAGPDDKPALLQIISDLEQLISLSSNSFESSSSNNGVLTGTESIVNGENTDSSGDVDQPVSTPTETEEDEEFRRFQVFTT